MRLFSALLLVVSLAFTASAFAAQKKGVAAPAKASNAPVERIYLESEVYIDELEKFAADSDGIPLSGTVQTFYPDGRLAWATQWMEGKLHGVTRGYYENRKLKEETSWVNGRLHGPARWYNEEGRLLRETVYENDKDMNAPDDDGKSSAQGSE